MTFTIVRPTTLEMSENAEHREHDDPTVPVGQSRPPTPPICRRMYRGDTLQIPVVVVDRRTQQPLNITGWKFWFTAKYAIPNPDAQAAFAQDNIGGGRGGITIVSATMGQVLIVAQPIATVGYPDGDVHLSYDVQAEDAAGIITTIEVGTLVVRPDVTRAISG